jgi:hypothetical protein
MDAKLGNFISVSNMTGHGGRGVSNAVKNQFIIETDRGEVFQSYSSIIAANVDGAIWLDRKKWDYSATTGKYRNIFLDEKKADTERKIKSGEYILTDLN